MKRRNAEFGKLRRPIKRNKIAEGMFHGSNTFLYVKYLILWAIVITADFMLDFRFEFLWPFWLLLRSVYDSFKYKGLAFTILFVCIAITSDLVCLFFVPVSWLFFLASTYVWVQYVWHAADKGFCLPTILLWALFLYLEGAIRWRDDKSIPHVDLCRPFAAHCIGYPVVTLGFGVKSYVGYRIRHRKQREVAKENEFYMQLLQFALPNDELLHAQMKQAPEILHSDKLGDIDLPVSSAIIAQRIQQQQLLMMSNSHAPPSPSPSSSSSSSSSSSTGNITSNGIATVVNANSSTSSSSSSSSASSSSSPSLNFNHNNTHNIRSNGHSNHKQVNGHTTMNGFSSTISTTSSQPSSTGNHQTLSTGTTSTSTIQLSHSNNSNNNNMNSSNLNLTATHNGFGMNHSMINSQTQSTNHFNSAQSTLTYRSNRRSMDRSENNKIGETISTSSSPASPSSSSSQMRTAALQYNDPIHEYDLAQSRSYLNMCLHVIYKMLIFIYCGFGKRRPTALNNATNARMPDSMFSRFLCALKYRAIGSGAVGFVSNSGTGGSGNIVGGDSANSYIRNVSNGNANEQIGYIERIDDENMEHHSDLHVNTKLAASFASHAPITIELPNNAASANAGYTSVQQQSNQQQHPSDMEKPLVSCKQNGHVESEHTPQMNGVESNCTTANNIGAESTERGRGRRNRGKQKEAQQQQQQHHHITQINKDNHSNSSTARNPSPLAQQTEHCETCSRLEVELKKMRSEVSHLKQIENELRQKCDQNSTAKSCLQAKQKENEELEKKLQELTSSRQSDRQIMQQTDRKLIEERRQRQSLETQLNNERKQRKLAEEKLSRIDCSESCKLRKQMLENECKQLRRDLSAIEELKKTAEQQSRTYEQELRKFEAELRSRETRESTEVLMSALQAMQDKNTTLEKSLSAETRVKLDLFSALGEAKRQLEIRDNVIRQKDKEVVDLKSKIAQLYAVMPSVPNESYLPSSGSSILRLSDTSPAPSLSHSDSIYSSKNDVA